MIHIYHNNRCSKSRACLAFLELSDKEFEVVEYLKNPLNFDQLKEITHQMNASPIDLVRTNEKIWSDVYKNQTLTDDEIIQAMVEHPSLIQRPIVVYNQKAVLARPLENVLSLLNSTPDNEN